MEMDALRDFFNRADAFAAHNGMRLTEVREGYARAQMTLAACHLNAAQTVHGGVEDAGLAADAQLVAGVAQVLLDRDLADLKGAGDLNIRIPERQEREHFQFATAQAGLPEVVEGEQDGGGIR